MSPDGYYKGPGANVMVLPMDQNGFDAYNVERLRAADTLLLGRESCEGFKGYWPGGIVRRADAHEEVAGLKQRDGKDILVFGSRTLWNDLLRSTRSTSWSGPSCSAEERPAFGDGLTTSLRLLDARTWEGSDNVLVRYAVAQPS